MISKILFIVIIFIVIFSCEQNEKDIQSTTNDKNVQAENSPEIRKPNTSEDFLLIIDYIPLNSDFNVVKQVLPDIYEQSYGRRKNNSKYFDINIFKKSTKIEFKFSTDMKLRSIIYRAFSLEFSEADSLYNKLKKYYKIKYGTFKEDIANLSEDSDYPFPILHYSSWQLSDFDFNIGLNESHKDCSLVWRYQKTDN